MRGRTLYIVLVAGSAAFAALLMWLTHGHNFPLLQTRGPVALEEHNLIVIASMLMLLIIVPVFMLTFWIVWKYRAGNSHAGYTPNWEHSATEEFVWWAVPCVIVLALATLAWTSTHELDPYRSLPGSEEGLVVQVVALNWKWLFIYPKQGIGTINYLEFPASTTVDFQITSDAPMNSFWIPQLGGQIYAMTGMVTQLHLSADAVGDYDGSSANFSGEGFSGMRFVAHAVSPATFDAWVDSVKRGGSNLDQTSYAAIAAPTINNPPQMFARVESGLFDSIIMKFMTSSSTTMSGMDMQDNAHN